MRDPVSLIDEALMSFTCPDCGMASYNPNDIQQGYCGNCHTFPEYRIPEDPDENMMDLFKRYDELTDN